MYVRPAQLNSFPSPHPYSASGSSAVTSKTNHRFQVSGTYDLTVCGTIHSPYRRRPGKSARKRLTPSLPLMNSAKGSGGWISLFLLMVRTSPSSE